MKMGVISVLLLAAGLGVLLYPHVQQRLYRQYARHLILDFEQRVQNYRLQSYNLQNYGTENVDDSLNWLHLLMVEYNKNLYETGQKNLVDPFSYKQVDFSLRQFGFAEEMIGYISIPKMAVELPIFLGASNENLKRGAAHLTQTSLPVGGINTNAVIAAHRGMSTAAMFRDIHLLEVGDEIMLTNFYEMLKYEVVEKHIILPTQINTVLIQSGRDLVTLLTCHPLRHNHQRYVVYAQRK